MAIWSWSLCGGSGNVTTVSLLGWTTGQVEKSKAETGTVSLRGGVHCWACNCLTDKRMDPWTWHYLTDGEECWAAWKRLSSAKLYKDSLQPTRGLQVSDFGEMSPMVRGLWRRSCLWVTSPLINPNKAHWFTKSDFGGIHLLSGSCSGV